MKKKLAVFLCAVLLFGNLPFVYAQPVDKPSSQAEESSQTDCVQTELSETNETELTVVSAAESSEESSAEASGQPFDASAETPSEEPAAEVSADASEAADAESATESEAEIASVPPARTSSVPKRESRTALFGAKAGSDTGPGDFINTVLIQDAEELAAVLLGEGVDIIPGSASVKFADAKQVGSFSGGEALLGIDSGLVLSTGYCGTSFHSGDSHSDGCSGSIKDSDLQALVAPYSLGGDTAILQFSMVANGSLLTFDYAFGSCEFDQEEEFNDGFGLFVSVNESAFENIALLENGNSVSIKNLRDSGAYKADDDFANSGFNGISNVLTAEKTVTPGDKVTLKLAIGDVSDNNFNSSVMIKSGSVSFNPPEAAPDYSDEKLTELEPGADYAITVDGEVYLFTADGDGTIPLAGTDKNGKAYDFFNKNLSIVRKGTSGTPDSPPQDLEIPNRPDAPGDPSAPSNVPDDINEKDVYTTIDSITVTAVDGQEYSIDGGLTWVKPSGDPLSAVFMNLTEDTEYTVITRLAATASSFASPSSAGVTVRTNAMFRAGDAVFSGLATVYNGQAKTAQATALPEGATAGYATALEGPYLAVLPSFTDAGTHDFYLCLKKDNYYNYYEKITMEISPAELTVEPDAGQSKYFGQTDPNLTYTYFGQVSGQTPAFQGTLERQEGEAAGNYKISLGTLALMDSSGFRAKNYSIKLSENTRSFLIQRMNIGKNDYVIVGYWSPNTPIAGPARWNDEPITVTPNGNYTQISLDGIKWIDSVTGSEEGADSTLSFYLKAEDGTVTEQMTVHYKLETSPHDWGSGTVVREPNHKEQGTMTYTCNFCGRTKTEAIPVIPHSFGDWTPVDETDHERLCSCGEKETAEHSWNNGVVTKEPSCAEDGVKTYTCTVCAGTKTEALAKKTSVDTVVNELTGIVIEGVDGTVFDSNLQLVLADKTETAYAYSEQISELAPGSSLVVLYDVKLMLNGAVIQPDGKIKISIPLTEEMQNLEHLQAVHIADDGTVSLVDSVRTENYLEITTDHLSLYGVIGEKASTSSTPSETPSSAVTSESENPATGDGSTLPFLAALFGISVLAIFGILAGRKIKK